MFENDSKCRIGTFHLLVFFINFCPIKSDLSDNTVWPQASGFQKLAKMKKSGKIWKKKSKNEKSGENLE